MLILFIWSVLDLNLKSVVDVFEDWWPSLPLHRLWTPLPQLELFIPTGHGTYWFPPMLPMTDLWQRSLYFCFLCLGCFCLWLGCLPAKREPQAGWGHGGVWLCAGLLFVVSSMASSRAGSHFITISFQETKVSCHSCVSTKQKHISIWCMHIKSVFFCQYSMFYFFLSQGKSTPKETVDM